MTKTKLLSIVACVCCGLCLLIWFLPGSYTYLYLGNNSTEQCVTSLFAFFPAPVLLPLICTVITILTAYNRKATRLMIWTFPIAAAFQGFYLGFIGAICLPYSYGETFIWLKAFPFPLTVAGTICFLLTLRTQAYDT